MNIEEFKEEIARNDELRETIENIRKSLHVVNKASLAAISAEVAQGLGYDVPESEFQRALDEAQGIDAEDGR